MATSVTAWPIAIPCFQAFDNSGNPLAGGKLNTYIAGTSTPLATYPTYADAIAGTNANANPVILDANGKAQVWIQAASYKFVLTDSNNVTLNTQDNVTLGAWPMTLTTVTKNGNQSNFATATKLSTWTVEADACSEWSAANNRWVANKAGSYLAQASVALLDTVAGVAVTIAIYKNGASVATATDRSWSTVSQIRTYTAFYPCVLAAGDYLEVFVTGTNVTTVQGTTSTRFGVIGV